MSGVFIYISVYTAEMYFQETRQKLDQKIAHHIANEYKYFGEDGLNNEAVEMIFHSVMIINPSIEVYLLDHEGKILSYFAPGKEIRIEYLPLKPIREFINSDDKFLLGIDPRHPSETKAFSAAEIKDNGELKGFIYVILGGEEYENASQLVFGSYVLRLGLRSTLIALVAASIIGFISIGFITKNMRKMKWALAEFKKGNHDARMEIKGLGELSEFSETFNDMADTIKANFEEIKKIESLRRELIANVSHDLRTPISVIHGYIETILIKEDSISAEEKREYLQTILGGSKRLSNLVEELFELSKLEARQVEPNYEKFSISELMQDVYQKNLILAKKKEITLNLALPEVSAVIYADISLIEKVFQNLLDNAIKYTERGGHIEIKAHTDNEKVFISINDNGIGISDKDIPFIFERYYKNKRYVDESEKSTGLGLAIVKKILELHKSSISVLSREKKGTTFSFDFPLA